MSVKTTSDTLAKSNWERVEITLERVVTMLDHLDARMTRIETAVPSAEALAALGDRISEVERDVHEASKPPYQLASLALTILIVIGGIVAYGINTKIDSIGSLTTNLSETFREHTSNGHPASVIAQIESNAKAIAAQIESNRRELDIITERLNRREDSIDARLRDLESEGRF